MQGDEEETAGMRTWNLTQQLRLYTFCITSVNQQLSTRC